ncbi:MAG TPA: DUF3224 domain-containing protein, partial [Gemmatimonadales bacterium]|nr:DUF3224 domain-containing protein [Gemmatimonadales bacterium]
DFPGAVLTQAWKINSRGQVAGRYEDAGGKWHVFLLSDGAFRSIDGPVALQTAAFPPQVGLNEQGDIVSSYCSAEPCPVRVTDKLTTEHGFLLPHKERDEAGEVTTIDFPGADGNGAFGINNHGNIVGAYVDANHKIHGFLRSRANVPIAVSGTFRFTFEPVATRQVDGNTITDFAFQEDVSGSIAGVRVGTGTLVAHPDGTLDVIDAGRFTGTVEGIPGSVIVEVRAAGTLGSFTATARFDPNSGTGGLRGLGGSVRVTGAATGPTTLAGSYGGQVDLAQTTDDH